LKTALLLDVINSIKNICLDAKESKDRGRTNWNKNEPER